MNNNAKNKTKQIVGIGVMTAIIAVLSQITIPLPTHVPVTLQTFAVALAGYFLGWKGGAVSALVYGLLGAIGVPVFAGWSGGFSVIVGYTGDSFTDLSLWLFFAVLAQSSALTR